MWRVFGLWFLFFFLLQTCLTKAPKCWFYFKHVLKDFCFWESWLHEKKLIRQYLEPQGVFGEISWQQLLNQFKTGSTSLHIISNGPGFITMKLMPVSEAGCSICQLASSLFWILIIFTAVTIKLCVTVMLCISGSYSASQSTITG